MRHPLVRPVVAALGAALVAAIVAALGSPLGATQGVDRLDSIRKRGHVSCGVLPEVPGFSSVDASGRYSGLDVDMCRALAVAILGDPAKVRFVRTDTVQEFLKAPDIDVVSRRLTWNLSREGRSGLRFGPVMFYDGQGFMVPRRSKITSPRQLAGVRVCVEAMSENEFHLGPYVRATRLPIQQVLLEPGTSIAEAFRTGRCQALTADVTLLGAIRSRFERPDDFAILPDMISKEPLAQVVRREDGLFFDVLRWTIFALINAEELGITSANVDEKLKSDDPAVQKLLGVMPGNGAAIGLREQWAYDIVKTLGNYGELFDRNGGIGSPIKLQRGLTRLWTAGGLMWAPPAR